jgi:hypothetical protein
MLDWELGESAFAAIKDLAVESRHSEQSALIYHTSFGDKSHAAALARQTLAKYAHDSVPTQHLPDCLNAAQALHRLGFVDEAEAAWMFAYSAAQAKGLLANQSTAAISLASLKRTTEDAAGFRFWHEQSSATVAASGDAAWLGRYLLNGIALAVSENRLTDASEYLRRALLTRQASQLEQVKLVLLAWSVRLDQLSTGKPCSPEALTRLEAGHLRGRRFNGHDDVALTLWHALALAGRFEEGTAMIREYVAQYRRDGYPLSSEMRRIVASDLAEAFNTRDSRVVLC